MALPNLDFFSNIFRGGKKPALPVQPIQKKVTPPIAKQVPVAKPVAKSNVKVAVSPLAVKQQQASPSTQPSPEVAPYSLSNEQVNAMESGKQVSSEERPFQYTPKQMIEMNRGMSNALPLPKDVIKSAGMPKEKELDIVKLLGDVFGGVSKVGGDIVGNTYSAFTSPEASKAFGEAMQGGFPLAIASSMQGADRPYAAQSLAESAEKASQLQLKNKEQERLVKVQRDKEKQDMIQTFVGKMIEAGVDENKLREFTKSNLGIDLPEGTSLAKQEVVSGVYGIDDSGNLVPASKKGGVYISQIDAKPLKNIITEAQLNREQQATLQREKTKSDRELKESIEQGRKEQKEALKAIGAKVPAGTVTELSDQKTSIEMTDDLIKKAFDIKGLTYSPVDVAHALNPLNTSAQSYQQIIQTTKQIIGKGLEGGVLRKEDESKYAKIIPKMGDTKEVLTAKINQLREMLSLKYNNNLNALADAGYNVVKFKEKPAVKYTMNEGKAIATFGSEEEAETSGYKGKAIIGGKKAVID
jgi:hypothetical protein